jgi:hypothetical protein
MCVFSFEMSETETGGDFSCTPSPSTLYCSSCLHPDSQSPLSSSSICLICFEERMGESHLSNSCKNTYGTSCSGDQVITRGVCHSCIDLYLTSAIESARVSGNGSIRCICPSRSCPLRYDREFVLSRVSGSEATLRRYERFVRNAAVAESESLRWCPREGCGNIVTVDVSTGRIPRQQRSQCDKCLLSFCSSCGNPHPSLVPCSMVSPSFLPSLHPQPPPVGSGRGLHGMEAADQLRGRLSEVSLVSHVHREGWRLSPRHLCPLPLRVLLALQGGVGPQWLLLWADGLRCAMVLEASLLGPECAEPWSLQDSLPSPRGDRSWGRGRGRNRGGGGVLPAAGGVVGAEIQKKEVDSETEHDFYGDSFS